MVRRTVAREEVSAAIRELLDLTGGWARDHGVAGPPLLISSLVEDGRLDLAPGWPVVTEDEPPPPIELLTLPAGPAAVHVHVGPYEDLPAVYDALWPELQARNLEPSGPPREIYESDPSVVTDPAQYVTRIVWPLAP